MPPQQTWNAETYDERHSFVWKRGEELVQLLAPKPGERILDVGCGTGHLTRRIAEPGAKVIGVDTSAEMIEAARRSYPAMDFQQMDARRLEFSMPFDAIFSNAALHWVKPPQEAARSMRAVLRPGGRLILEMGGKNNVGTIITALHAEMEALGISLSEMPDLLYFPSISEYSALLEDAGFDVHYCRLYDRPTPLQGRQAGLRDWLWQFKTGYLELIPEHRREAVITAVNERCRPKLWRGNQWFADYRRLQVVAFAV